jgi:hypothetical protein
MYESAVLKFYLPIAVFLFGVFPARLWSFGDLLPKKKAQNKNLYLAGAALPSILVVVLFALSYTALQAKNNKGRGEIDRIVWLKRISKPEDIIFSNKLVMHDFPPHAPYLLRKPVWNFMNLSTLQHWRMAFGDAMDYPMLWIEKALPGTPECVKLYEKEGGKEVSQFEDLRAFQFPSAKHFIDIKDPRLDRCLSDITYKETPQK